MVHRAHLKLANRVRQLCNILQHRTVSNYYNALLGENIFYNDYHTGSKMGASTGEATALRPYPTHTSKSRRKYVHCPKSKSGGEHLASSYRFISLGQANCRTRLGNTHQHAYTSDPKSKSGGVRLASSHRLISVGQAT